MSCLVASTAPATAASDAQWLDIESQIQYAYYTEDPRGLGNLGARLGTQPDAQPLQAYYAALAFYRLALLAAELGQPQAESAAGHCSAKMEQALTVRQDWADALALQGACLGLLAERTPLRAALARRRSRALLARALALEANNPRVLLLDGSLLERSSRGTAAAKARACGEFAAAVAAFEAARPQADRVPEWGAAEGYAFRARCDLERGDAAAARDALERALLIAPDFQLARRLVARITAD